jgi:hypothetical protein
MPKIIRLSCYVYRRMLIFYPRDLRRRFGSEMVEVFADQLSEVALEQRSIGMLSLWGTALWELLSVAAPARLQSTTLIACTVSFLASSAMFLAILGAVKHS